VQPLIPGAYFRTDSSVLPSPDDDQIVQFKGNNWNGVLQLLREFKRDGPPSREDVWLAQEDLWVKRELLAVIRAANDAIAHFKEVTPGRSPQSQLAPAGDAKVAKDAKDAKSAKPVPKPPPAPASDPNHKVFRNYFWEMELTLSRGPKQTYLLGGKLTNIGKRRQPLGVFRVYLDSSPDSDPTLLPIENEPLAVGQSVEFTKRPVDRGVNIRGLFGVEQVLTWRTAPVKRIDELRIDYHASRLSRRSLVEPRWVEKAAAQEATTPGTGTSMSMGGNTGDMKGGGTMPMMGGVGGRTGSQGMTRNGFHLQRYIDTNDQVRHMPVAMVVIADEDFIHEFLGAFANSRLRTQTLQYHWHHVREKIKPQSEQVAGGPGAERKGGANAGEANMGGARGGPGRGGMKEEMGGMIMGRMMSGLSGRMRGGAGGFTPGGTGLGKSMTETEDEDDAEMNLVELAVYGLASVYENPAKPQVAAAPDGQVAPK